MAKQVIDVDTLVIGAGILGSSTAYHLANLRRDNVVVIDPNLDGSKFSSSMLNAGGVRTTWTQEPNVAISKASIDFYAQIADEVGYRPLGYLWLRTPADIHVAEQAVEIQQRYECDAEILDASALQDRFPFVTNVDGVAGATFAKPDGLIDSHMLRQWYRERAGDLGVQFENRQVVVGCEYNRSNQRKAKITVRVIPKDADLKNLLWKGEMPEGEDVVYRARAVINCAGAWAGKVGNILRYDVPSKPFKRQIGLFKHGGIPQREKDELHLDSLLTSFGLAVDTSGVYFHSEGKHLLTGFADKSVPPGIDFEFEGYDWVGPKIHRPLFNRIEVVGHMGFDGGWAGLFMETPDHSAIVGEVIADNVPRGVVYECHSGSGHGVMQAHILGLSVAELRHFKQIKTEPLAEKLSGRRFRNESAVEEPNPYVI